MIGRCSAVALTLITLAAGCDPGDGEALTIATAWPADARARAEALLHQVTAARVRWVVLATGDDVAHAARRRWPPDMILGGPESSYGALARRGLLDATDEGRPAWLVVPGSALGSATSEPARRALRSRAAVGPDDPRRDPYALRRAKAVLDSGEWSVGYARLVGDPSGSWEAADLDPAEGLAVVRGSRHAAAARSVLNDLAVKSGWTRPRTGSNPDADALLADLLGAALVDASEELVSARSALVAAGKPSRSWVWMTEAPPWPPASVGKILARRTNAMSLLETLAAQVGPDPGTRAWLLRSWLAPPRRIDGRVLDELAGAADGRLVREPRFRAWLRAEWTAWARQRYRRVARQAATADGSGAPAS